MQRILFVLIILLAGYTAKSQYADSLHEIFKLKSSIDARIESRNSFINNQLISVFGLRLGVSFNRKIRMGGGISWMNTEFYEQHLISQNPDLLSPKQYFKFAYLCYYVDFVFYKIKRWQLSVPIQMGFGMCWWQQSQGINLYYKSPKYFLPLYEPGISTQFKVFTWLGLGADINYRFVLRGNKQIGENLNSPTYSFKLLFWFDNLFYELFPKSKISQKYGPAVW
ncbi:MAG: hypothetical protein JSU07_06095 [Bacteroidetes bacterium]|nr:hypothetical protein [Bacteroidota bacterium]